MVLKFLQRIDRNTTITQQREDDEQVDRFGKQVQSVAVAVPSQIRMNHEVIPRPYNLLYPCSEISNKRREYGVDVSCKFLQSVLQGKLLFLHIYTSLFLPNSDESLRRNEGIEIPLFLVQRGDVPMADHQGDHYGISVREFVTTQV